MTWIWIALAGAVLLGFYLGILVMGILAAAATIPPDAHAETRRRGAGVGNGTDLDLDGVGIGCGPGLGCGGDARTDGLACRGMRR